LPAELAALQTGGGRRVGDAPIGTRAGDRA
jgi:hypothetical protein